MLETALRFTCSISGEKMQYRDQDCNEIPICQQVLVLKKRGHWICPWKTTLSFDFVITYREIATETRLYVTMVVAPGQWPISTSLVSLAT